MKEKGVNEMSELNFDILNMPEIKKVIELVNSNEETKQYVPTLMYVFATTQENIEESIKRYENFCNIDIESLSKNVPEKEKPDFREMWGEFKADMTQKYLTVIDAKQRMTEHIRSAANDFIDTVKEKGAGMIKNALSKFLHKLTDNKFINTLEESSISSAESCDKMLNKISAFEDKFNNSKVGKAIQTGRNRIGNAFLALRGKYEEVGAKEKKVSLELAKEIVKKEKASHLATVKGIESFRVAVNDKINLLRGETEKEKKETKPDIEKTNQRTENVTVAPDIALAGNMGVMVMGNMNKRSR